MLKICLPNEDIILEMLSEPIGLFVVMLILSFILPGLLIVLYISSTFFEEILKKLSLIFNIFLILKNKAYVYKCLFLLLESSIGLLSLFWKNFDFFRIFLLSLDRIEGKKTLLVLSNINVKKTHCFFLLPLSCIGVPIRGLANKLFPIDSLLILSILNSLNINMDINTSKRRSFSSSKNNSRELSTHSKTSSIFYHERMEIQNFNIF